MINLSYYLKDALVDCEAALDSPEKWPSACAIVSHLFDSAGKTQSAYLWRMFSQQNQPSRLSYHIQAGMIYAELKNWQAAIAHNHKALKLHQDLAIAYFNLSHLYHAIGKPKTSLNYFYRFMALRPEQPSAAKCEALGQAFLKQGKRDRAMRCYRWAIENDPTLWSAYYQLADLLVQSGKLDTAIICYRKLLKQDPTQVDGQQKLGMLLLDQKRYGQAIEHFRQATQLKPDFVWPYFGLVKTLMELKQWDEAIASCQATIALVEPVPWAYSNMAKALMEKGDLDQVSLCHQQTCALQGWSQCPEQGYQFTRDSFSYKISAWRQLLQPLRERAQAINVLEIGNYQGMSACWLLDTVLVRRSDRLTCIDTQISPYLKSNLTKTTHAEASSMVSQYQGDTLEAMLQLESASYDLINLQDRCKQAEHLYQVARQGWRLLKAGGVMILNDYQWSHPDGPKHSPKAGYDRLLAKVSNQYKLLAQGRELWIQKR